MSQTKTTKSIKRSSIKIPRDPQRVVLDPPVRSKIATQKKIAEAVKRLHPELLRRASAAE